MDGQISKNDEGYLIQFERVLPHPPEQVWSAITDPDERADWFFPGVLELKVGGRVALEDSSQGVTGTVTALQPGHLIEFAWTSLDATLSTVRFDIQADDAGTRLIFSHQVTEGRPENLTPGWHCLLDDLPKHLRGETITDIPGRHAIYRSRYLAMLSTDA